MNHDIWLVGCISLGGVAFDVHSQTRPLPDFVMARAVGGEPLTEVVEYVASHAEFTLVDLGNRPELAKAPLRLVIEQQCGMVNDAYVAAFARLNNVAAVDVAKPAEVVGATLAMPACLYASRFAKQTYTIAPNDTMTGIRQRFTGDGADRQAEIDKFFAASDLSHGDARALPVGRAVPITEVTELVLLRSKVATATFVEELTRIAGGTAVATSYDKPAGGIIGPVRFDGPGALQGSQVPCQRGDGLSPYPLDGKLIHALYFAAKDETGESTERVTVTVVDNGFFGVPCPDPEHCPDRQADGRLKLSERFPARYFDYASFSDWDGLGPMISGFDVYPLNYRNNRTDHPPTFSSADINDETGHGTHVAGLTIGGPRFYYFRDALANGSNSSWLKLAIVNIGKGNTQLQPAVEQRLIYFLEKIEKFKVVNMSIAFDGRADDTIAKTLDRSLIVDDLTLFVVAAGNEWGSLEEPDKEYYPARFGGGSRRNLLTIASIDGPVAGLQRLSAFSNRSSKHVDLAAPGCAVDSWVDAERPPEPVTGTSQAAPIVTFAAALLRSLWHVGPKHVANRLMYSGTLLDVAADSEEVRSKAQLNIPQALAFPWTRLEFTKAGQTRVLLGKLGLVQGIQCEKQNSRITPRNLRALKRRSDGRLAIYHVDSRDVLSVCWGRGLVDVPLDFKPEYELIGGALVFPGRLDNDIRLSEVVDLVRDR